MSTNDIQLFIAESIEGPYYRFVIERLDVEGTLRNVDFDKGLWRVTARAVDGSLDFDLRGSMTMRGIWEASEAKQWVYDHVMSIVNKRK